MIPKSGYRFSDKIMREKRFSQPAGGYARRAGLFSTTICAYIRGAGAIRLWR